MDSIKYNIQIIFCDGSKVEHDAVDYGIPYSDTLVIDGYPGIKTFINLEKVNLFIVKDLAVINK